MRQSTWSALVLTALLGSCGPTALPDARPLTVAEVRPLYVTLPDTPLPEQSRGPLGDTYAPGGHVVNWRASTPVDLHAWKEGQREPAVVGQLLADGALLGLPPVTVRGRLPVEELLGASGTYCPVQALESSGNPTVGVTRLILALRSSDRSVGLQVQTSVVPQWEWMSPDLTAWERPQQSVELYLINVQGALTVRGESRCIGGVVQTQPTSWKTVEQRHVQANLHLEPGWNALLLMRKSLGQQGETRLEERIWQVLPPTVLERWRI